MRTVLTSLLLLLAMLLPMPSRAADAAPVQFSATQVATQNALRDLWVEHIFWIRNYVVASAANDTVSRDAAVTEVVANAKSIAGTIAPFYGDAASEQLFGLLAGHWGAVKAHADATLADDPKSAEKAIADLTSNAKAIAAFLSGANPNLPEATLVGLLSAHGAHHVAQNGYIKNHDAVAEAKTWAAMRGHMFTIADAIAAALAKQFPEKF